VRGPRLVGVAALAALLLTAGGCANLRNLPVFTVSIVNDTADAVVVRDCSGYCSSSPIALDLQPGASADIHRTTNDHKEFSIRTASGGHVGCLDLFFRTPQPGARLLVSSAVPCKPSRAVWKTYGLVALVLLVCLTPMIVPVTRRRRGTRSPQTGGLG
jgi:hypothetical protein